MLLTMLLTQNAVKMAKAKMIRAIKTGPKTELTKQMNTPSSTWPKAGLGLANGHWSTMRI